MSKKQKPVPTKAAVTPTWAIWMVRALLGLAGLLALWALGKLLGGQPMDGWGDYGMVIVRNQIVALLHGAVLLAAAAGFIHLMTRPASTWPARRLAWALAGLVALDALWLSRHYVQTMSGEALEENEVIRLLKSERPRQRVALISQDGFYNQWLTYLFPYHGIQALNITQMPRMPVEYQKYLGTLTRRPGRYWQLGAVGYVLAPVQIWGQIQNDPSLRDLFTLALAYDVMPADGGGTKVFVNSSGQHVVLRMKDPGPRFTLSGAWQAAPDEEALRLLAEPAHPLFDRVLVAPEQAAGLPASGEPGRPGSVELVEYRPDRIRLKVTAERPALLRVADKYDPAWRASVDGQPASLLRVDYLFRGLPVAAGTHEVLMQYQAGGGTLWLLAAGLVLCGGATLHLMTHRSASSIKETAAP